MKTKLTLSIEEQVIEEAKAYAIAQGSSLSEIVEKYLTVISKSRPKGNKSKFHPLVEELCGSVKIPNDETYDEILGEALIEKYSNR